MRSVLLRPMNVKRTGSFYRFLSEATLAYQHGHPILTVELPSRKQPVMFTCKPVTGTVGSLLADIIKTDGGVYEAGVYTMVRKMICIKINRSL
jgi:hypothetical protein